MKGGSDRGQSSELKVNKANNSAEDINFSFNNVKRDYEWGQIKKSKREILPELIPKLI